MIISRIKTTYKFLIVFALWMGQIGAQVQKVGIPEIEYFNRREYNGATQNWGVTQGASEFMYFANNSGVLEFDGVNWRLLNEFGSHLVRSVKADGNRIYVGSYNELGYFSPDIHNNMTYKSLVQNSKITELEDIWSIHKWNNEIVFRSQKGLCFYKEDKYQAIIPAISRFLSAFVVNGLLLIHDEENGLYEVRGHKAYPISGGKILKGKIVKTVMSLSENKILIGTMNSGLYIWDMQEIKPWDVSANELLKEVNVFCGIKYNKDLFVIGTIQGGLVVIDKEGNVFMQINKDKGLKNNTMLSVFVDKEGNIWGGLDNGIVKVNFNSTISYLQGYYDLGTGYVLDKYRDNYYFGTNQSLYKISEKGFNNPLKDRGNFQRVRGTEGQVWSLYHDKSTLLCGHDLGAFQINGTSSEVITPIEINGVWNFKHIPDNPNLLISGTYTGLIIFEKNKGKWTYRNKVKGFNESTRFMEWDNNGKLWVSHGYGGVYKLDINESLTEIVEVQNFKNTDIGDNKSSVVLSRINNECYFSSQDGIYKLNEDLDGFEKDLGFERLFKNGEYPNCLSQDQYRNIWCFSRGAVKVLRHLEDGSYREIAYPFISLENKLVNAFEFLYVVDKNNVFFGIEDGFAHYSADEFKNYQTPFNIHIRSLIEANDSIIYRMDGNAPVQTEIPKFAFRKNAITINFAASFFENRDIKYATSLSGHDNYTTNWSKSNNISYSNLYEGEYHFEVRAKNRYGVESLPIKFKFIILPPWHRSIPAKIGFAFVFLILLGLVYYSFSKRLELSKRKEKAKQLQRFKSKEEKLKNVALQSEKEMIKMRNDKLRGEMVFKEKELANSTIHLIQKNELLSDIKSQLKKIIRTQDHNDLDRKVGSLIKKIDRDIDNENNWEVFEMHFGQVHEEFLNRLVTQHPDLTQREQKLTAFIKMGMSSKEIASIMNITTRAVENNRYKLRQKLGVSQGDNLSAYIGKL